MKKFILGAIVSVTMLSANIANAEFVLGVQGGSARIDTDDAIITDDTDWGFGFYAQAMGETFGIHVGTSSYSFEAFDSSNTISGDVDVLDILGVVRWQNNFFLMAGRSEYDSDIPGLDGDGWKIAAGWDRDEGSVVVSPSVSVAEYGGDIDVTNTVWGIGFGYKF